MSIGDLIQYQWFINEDTEIQDILLVLAVEKSDDFYDMTALDSQGKIWIGTMHEIEFEKITL